MSKEVEKSDLEWFTFVRSLIERDRVFRMRGSEDDKIRGRQDNMMI